LGDAKRQAEVAAKGGRETMMMREGKVEGGAGKGEWGGEVLEVEVAAAEVARRWYRQRRAVGDGEVEVLHRRPRKEAGGGRRAVVLVSFRLQFQESDLYGSVGSLNSNG
jgi:hypothetical protein